MGAIEEAQAFLAREGLDGWLVYDHRRSNPVFADLTGEVGMLTRPLFYLIPAHGQPRLLVHSVDAGKLARLQGTRTIYANQTGRLEGLIILLAGKWRVAMEYYPQAALPLASRVDGGTLELVRGLGVEVVSSADLVQFATTRWSPQQLATHRSAARKLTQIVLEAFRHVAQRLQTAETVTEHGLQQFIQRSYTEQGLEAPDGPIVAANAHASDPHYEPEPAGSALVRQGDALLLDIWARERGEEAVYADITWVAFVGTEPPPPMRKAFALVVRARDAAVDFLARAAREGRTVRGFEVDAVARRIVEQAGYGDAFTHRLGHSIGREVHGNGVNLDGWETMDTRPVIPCIGFSVEPGIYLPEFGVRSEIDVYMTATGPEVTTEPQRDIVLIGAGTVGQM
ncbi:MAG: M24 family metallopeptidase [Chloroflexi bacterium]|nr:M24 family metallopeptidase [Chloroflexota bacterium]